MKKLILIIIILVIIGGGAFFLMKNKGNLGADPVLSDEQEEIRQIFGQPYQFMVTYLPRGTSENPTLIRNEVWLYPIQEKKIIFLGGNLAGIEDYLPEEIALSATQLKPEDFEFHMSLSDIENLIGAANIELVDLPGFYETEELETYMSDKAVFIVERGKLTYIQTFGFVEAMEEDQITE